MRQLLEPLALRLAKPLWARCRKKRFFRHRAHALKPR